jgi:hypothetical protein
MRRCQAAQGHVSQRGGRLAAPSTPACRRLPPHTKDLRRRERARASLGARCRRFKQRQRLALARSLLRKREMRFRLFARAAGVCTSAAALRPPPKDLASCCVCAAPASLGSSASRGCGHGSLSADAAAACAARLILALRCDAERGAPRSLRRRPEARTTSICRPARDLRCCLPRLLSVPHVGVPRGEARPAADAAPRQAFLSWSGSSRRACARSRSGSMTILRWCWLCRCDAAVLQLQRLRCTTVSKYRASDGASASLATLEAGRPSSAARACAAAPIEAQARAAAAGAKRQSTLRCRRFVVLGRPQGVVRAA